MPSDEAAGGFQPDIKLHPLSWVFKFFQFTQAFLPVFLAAYVGTSEDSSIRMIVIAVLFLPIILNAFWQQYTYRYGFSEKGLVIHEGLINRNIRTIDYARIENVDTRRGILHQMLGVAQVQVETSSGGKAEASIRVLGLEAVEEMRTHIFEQRAQIRESAGDDSAVAAEAEEELLLHLETSELVRYGLINNRGMVVVAAMVALVSQTGFFERLSTSLVVELLPYYEILSFGWLTNLIFGIVVIVIFLVGLRLLSVILAVVTFHDFRLSQRGEDLRSEYGLLTKISLTLRQRRIQVVHWRATFLHRMFKRVSLQVDLAGGVAGQENAQSGGNAVPREVWLAPICSGEDADRLIRVALPQTHLDNLDWQRLPIRARGRLFRRNAVTWIIIATAPAIFFTGWWAALILPGALPLLWFNAHLYVKYSGWSLEETFFAFRRGWMTRKISLAPVNRIQSLCVSESPFDRRYRMAKLTVDTAGASSPGRRLEIRFLERAMAEELAGRLYKSEIG